MPTDSHTSNPQPAESRSKTADQRGGRRFVRRLGVGLLLVVLLLGLSTAMVACVGYRTLEREIAETPRDPETGVILGCEAIDLDPPGAAADQPTSACLLLHGFLGCRRDFADLPQRLAAAGYHVRAARLPGHGTTPRDFARQTPETMIEGARTEWERLEAEYDEVTIIGFSMGGALGTLIAAKHPVDRLVLIAPYFGVKYRWFYILPAETWNMLFSPLVPYVARSDRFIQLNRSEAKDELFSYRTVPTRGAVTLIELGKLARQPETLGAIDCPVLMVMAEGDQAASPRRAGDAFDQIAADRKQAVWLSERSNHQILWDYEREEAKQAVLDFLTTSSTASDPR